MKPRTSPPPLHRRLWSGWMRVADWLGARRPLDLVCGMMIVIVAGQGLCQLLFDR